MPASDPETGRPTGSSAAAARAPGRGRTTAEQEKLIKLGTLPADPVVLRNAPDMDVVRGLAADGWTITADRHGAAPSLCVSPRPLGPTHSGRLPGSG